MIPRPPTSFALEAMLDAVVAEKQVTLNWLLERLGERSFGIVLLLLAILGLLPGVSAVAGILLMVPAMQMILARSRPIFPDRVGERHFDARRLGNMVRRAVPVIRWLERFIRPRWYTPFEATKRVVGGIVLLLGASLLVPLPLSNVLPALAITFIAFAYLEEDGLLLCAALLAALAILATTGILLWETASATGWLPGLL
ncbi:exopolysaccharide biosynthesis protein [Roseomonas sp. CAU 1739]|uniref:exopolysaccharide biosynthesis protein n=1 Tax=Roseomonas sp. CAU 1739 TaxID=3140364 RepID=UPI00325AD075